MRTILYQDQGHYYVYLSLFDANGSYGQRLGAKDIPVRVYPHQGKTILLIIDGFSVQSQVLLEDPGLLKPEDVISHAFIHNVFIPRAKAILKKRHRIQKSDDPYSLRAFIFYDGKAYGADILEDFTFDIDEFRGPSELYDCAYFGSKGASNKHGYDRLNELSGILSLEGINLPYPLARVNDWDYQVEYLWEPSLPWRRAEA